MGETMAPRHESEFNVTVVEQMDYDEQLEPITSDLWIGIVLILMILSCIGCVCSCLLYHKFQQWKQHERRNGLDPECPRRPSSESLPSYTLVTGLPTYDQAMEAARKGKGQDISQLSPASLVLLFQPPPPFTETKS